MGSQPCVLTDIPLLGALAPLTFLSKAEVRAWPLAGWLAEKAGTLFIRRGSSDSRLINQRLAEQLHRGRNLLIFPEGTTTNGESLRTFHCRLMASALEAGVAVQPVAISYRRDGVPDALAPFIGDDDLLSHLGRLLRGERGSVHIQLLEPIPSQGLDRAELARQAQQAVRLALFGTAAPTQTRRAALSRLGGTASTSHGRSPRAASATLPISAAEAGQSPGCRAPSTAAPGGVPRS